MAVRSEVVWYQEEVQRKNNNKSKQKNLLQSQEKKNQIFRVFKNIFKKEK